MHSSSMKLTQSDMLSIAWAQNPCVGLPLRTRCAISRQHPRVQQADQRAAVGTPKVTPHRLRQENPV
eukprot:5448069-Pyramimonas_sp.AAC.2